MEKRPPRPDEDLARMVVSVAKATQVDGIICITETGALAQHLFRLSGEFRGHCLVLEGSKQLVPNPFQKHGKSNRMLTNPEIHDALVELSKLDGAFVVRGDGFIQAAGVFLTSPPSETELVSGLGTRHAAASAVTMHTMATAIVVSATDGQGRGFSGGKMVIQIDPEIAQGHISMIDKMCLEMRTILRLRFLTFLYFLENKTKL